MRRAWKPLVLATAVAAFSLFYSCKKIDPRELIGKKPVAEDTTSFGKMKFKEIGARQIEIKKEPVRAWSWEKELPLPSTKNADSLRSR